MPSRFVTAPAASRHSPAMALVICLSLIVLAPVAADAQEADKARGQLLYENHCTVCHTSVVHVREKRKAESKGEIRRWILRWQAELKLDWQRQDVEDVLQFLNARYYQLDSES